MSVRSDECLSKILLQLKIQAIIVKDYWPLKGLLGSRISLCLCSIVFVFIRENNWRRFPLVLKGINADNYPRHSSLIKLISIIVQVKAHNEALSSSHWPNARLPQRFWDFVLFGRRGEVISVALVFIYGLVQFVLCVRTMGLFGAISSEKNNIVEE